MLTIETVSNGWILRNKWNENDDGEAQAVSVISHTEDGITGKMHLLYEVIEMLEIYGSRYDKWRINITKRHGDKWEPNKEETCKY